MRMRVEPARAHRTSRPYHRLSAMPSLPPRALRQSAGDLSFSFFLVTVVLCLFAARDLPSSTFGAAGTDVSIGPADVGAARSRPRSPRSGCGRDATCPSPWLLARDGGVRAADRRLRAPERRRRGRRRRQAGRARCPRRSPPRCSSTRARSWRAARGSARRLLHRRRRLGRRRVRRATAAAGRRRSWASTTWPRSRRWRSSSGSRRSTPRPDAARPSRSSALGAARSGSCSARRSRACSASTSPRPPWSRSRAVAATSAAAPSSSPLARLVAVTAGTFALRSGELGFLQSWFGPPPETPGQYAASWSQRLIYVYIGGRVFLDQPAPRHRLARRAAAGGVRAVPARRPRAVPRSAGALLPARDGRSIPQQTYDQVLFELGLVGAALLLVLVVLAVAACRRRRARSRPREPGTSRRTSRSAGSPCSAGALAGAALFGGSPLAALFWLTLGRRRGSQLPVARPVIAHAAEDRPRDRPPQRRRRRAARAPARAASSRGGATTSSSSPARSRRRGVDGVRRRRARRRRCCKLPALQRELSLRADAAAILALRSDHRASAGRTFSTRTPRRRAPPAGSLRSRLDERARALSSTPTTATSSAATSAGAGSGSSGWIERGLRTTRGRSSPSATRSVTTSSASASRRRERFVVVPYGFDLPPGARPTRRRVRAIRAELGPATRRSSSAGRAG